MATAERPSRPRVLHLGPEDHGRLVSPDEFAEAETVAPWKYERENGRLSVMAPDGQGHVESSEPWWKGLFRYFLDHDDVVERVVPAAWLRIDGGKDRIGDIGVYLVADGPQPPIPDRVPDLMFEVVSPGSEARQRDYIEKRADYERRGVREYVIVDRFAATVTVLTLEAGVYQERVLGRSETYATPLLPGFALALDAVFPED